MNYLNTQKLNGIEKINVIPPASHANFLNTNYKFAYLARKNKAQEVIKHKHQQGTSERNISNHDIKSSQAIDVTLGLKKRRRKRVLKRKKNKKSQFIKPKFMFKDK